MHTIYKATNLIDGKAYVGYSSNFESRKYKHEWCSDNCPVTHFHRAIRKYGKNSFVWEVLYESSDKEHTWLVMEEHFIKLHNTHAEDGHGYNYSYGGFGSGRVMTETAVLNIRNGAKIRKPATAETIKKRSDSNRGRKRSAEFCKYMSTLNSGRIHNEQSKRNFSESQKKKIEIDGIVYTGLVQAANGLNIPKYTLMRKMKNGKIKYKRITK